MAGVFVQDATWKAENTLSIFVAGAGVARRPQSPSLITATVTIVTLGPSQARPENKNEVFDSFLAFYRVVIVFESLWG